MEYVKARGINYTSELQTIKKKAGEVLQPVYEAFTNAWEAIIEKFTFEHLNNGRIEIKFYVNTGVFKSSDVGCSLDKITIIGLDRLRR